SPVRTIASAPAGKHAIWVLFEQQAWLTPPLASMQRPSASVVTQALPVHVALQLPAPHEFATGAPHVVLEVELLPVVSGSVSCSVPAGLPDGVQSADTFRWRVVLPETTSMIASVRQARPAFRPVLHVPVSPTPLPEHTGHTCVGSVR